MPSVQTVTNWKDNMETIRTICVINIIMTWWARTMQIITDRSWDNKVRKTNFKKGSTISADIIFINKKHCHRAN